MEINVDTRVDFDATVARQREKGFLLLHIFPADAPRWAELSMNGESCRIVLSNTIDPNDRSPEESPGRAGMLYRDLIPGRLNGSVIASHISIPGGGPVPDNVHHHQIHVQAIFCVQGWVRLVYEDQGEPFVMRKGDCVLQPPHIRHRVLESGDDLEVVEVSSPAEHMTTLDHEMALPTDVIDVDRRFGGQTFLWHKANTSVEVDDFGLFKATGGIASARVVYHAPAQETICHLDHLFFRFVLSGQLSVGGKVVKSKESVHLIPGSAMMVKATPDCSFFEMRIHAEPKSE